MPAGIQSRLWRHCATIHEPAARIAAGSYQQVGTALTLLHDQPARRWTVADLAAAVSMSRSSFAVRFRTLVGLPPLDYLVRWRMQIAARALRRTDRTVADIGSELGYTSESAFSNAFKRVLGQSPSRYRRAQAIAGGLRESARPGQRGGGRDQVSRAGQPGH